MGSIIISALLALVVPLLAFLFANRLPKRKSVARKQLPSS